MKQNKKGFTLIELLVVIAIIALLIGILLPALGKARKSAQLVTSQANLRSMGQSSMNYAADFKDGIFSYSWKAGGVYKVEGKKRPGQPKSYVSAAALQAMDIVRRRTGRAEGTTRIKNLEARLMHRRYSHFVLFDYLTVQFPEPIAASPFDRNLLEWQEDPLLAEEELVPYAHGNPGTNGTGYMYEPNWIAGGIPQIWPYSSTYQVVPAAWNPDKNTSTITSYSPVEDDPYLFTGENATPDAPLKLGGRRYGQVMYPAQKVHMFEEYDRFSDSKGLFYAYPEAKTVKLFFDGSVNQSVTSDSGPGWDPGAPNVLFEQTYLALDTFPLPQHSLDGDINFLWFRWTREGLQGVDYGGDEINLPDVVRDSTTPPYPVRN